MNTNLLTIVKQLIASNGENILGDPQRLKSFFNDLAKDEPKPLRLAFGRCIESGAYAALKTAPDAVERGARKTAIALQVRDEYGLDITLCAEALDILEAALFGENKPKKALCLTCGRELEPDWTVCPFCGAGEGKTEGPAPVEPARENTPAAETTPQGAQESQPRRTKDFLVLRIFSILFYPGWFLGFGFEDNWAGYEIFSYGFRMGLGFACIIGFTLGMAIFTCIIARKYQLESIIIISIICLLSSFWQIIVTVGDWWGYSLGLWILDQTAVFIIFIFPLFTLVQSIRRRKANTSSRAKHPKRNTRIAIAALVVVLVGLSFYQYTTMNNVIFDTAESIFVTGSDVYVAGSTVVGNDVSRKMMATYWENGQAVRLGNSFGRYAGANSIFVFGTDVYVAGEKDSKPAYWKNGRAVRLSNNISGWFTDNSIFVTDSDIYVAGSEVVGGGYDYEVVATYWKNGEVFHLSSNVETGANSIYVIGSDVYVAGYEKMDENYRDWRATYWKNGQAVHLSNSFSAANSIFIVVSDVYIAGYEGGSENYEDMRAIYWKNGQAVRLSNSTSAANSIFVTGSDVYIAGVERVSENYEDRRATYWKNGQAVRLSNNPSEANSIFVTDSGVYVAGYEEAGEKWIATYWKNGQAVRLGRGKE
jgi:hypothetical protein